MIGIMLQFETITRWLVIWISSYSKKKQC